MAPILQAIATSLLVMLMVNRVAKAATDFMGGLGDLFGMVLRGIGTETPYF